MAHDIAIANDNKSSGTVSLDEIFTQEVDPKIEHAKIPMLIN